MIQVTFTENIQRHLACPPGRFEGRTVHEVLEACFEANPRARGYILDDRGVLRHHMIIFINGRTLTDRQTLSDPVPDNAEVYVMQALSGG